MALRLPSAILSTLALVPFYFLARQVVSRLAALIAALLLACNLWYLLTVHDAHANGKRAAVNCPIATGLVSRGNCYTKHRSRDWAIAWSPPGCTHTPSSTTFMGPIGVPFRNLVPQLPFQCSRARVS